MTVPNTLHGLIRHKIEASPLRDVLLAIADKIEPAVESPAVLPFTVANIPTVAPSEESVLEPDVIGDKSWRESE